ncbi:MAG: PTS glucose transporter subunit IIA, partial [Lachnospiraceae bacterium]|nr:PTS glucose transporter subunit IIA [Lachnospiraceae bacterium]
MKKQNVQYIRPVLTGCIGGFAGALVVGLFHMAVNLNGSSWLGIWMTANGTLRYLIDMAVAFVTAFLLSWILFRWEGKSGGGVQTASKTANEELPGAERVWSQEEMQIMGNVGAPEKIPLSEITPSAEERQTVKKGRFMRRIGLAKQEKKKQTETGVIYSPLQGQVIPMEEVPDDTFAAKVLGDGMAVIPSEGTVYAPFDGRVEKVYDTKHAISISSIDGIEVLIHVGIN